MVLEDPREDDIRQTVAFRGGFYNKALHNGRKAKGISQEMLRDIVRDMIGRPLHSSISDYETLKAYPDPTEARAIADALNLPIEVIFPARLASIKQKHAWQEIYPETLSLTERHQLLAIPSETSLEDLTEQKMLRDEVASLLEGLTGRQRRILEMHFGLGTFTKKHTLDEISRSIGMPIADVQSTYQKAMRRIRRLLSSRPLSRKLHSFLE